MKNPAPAPHKVIGDIGDIGDIGVIGIVGGVGPFAGLDLNAKVFDQTLATKDQDHLETILVSASPFVTDRTRFLLGQEPQNPARGILRTLRKLEATGATVCGIACNTAHVAEIMGVVEEELRWSGSPIRLLHMIEESAEFLRRHYAHCTQVGVLSTTGTYREQLYPKVLGRYGIRFTDHGSEAQELVNDAIYDPDYGIKAQSNPVTETAVGKVEEVARKLHQKGAQAVLLACTELPLALPQRRLWDMPLIDPTVILARALIREAAPHKLKPWCE